MQVSIEKALSVAKGPRTPFSMLYASDRFSSIAAPRCLEAFWPGKHLIVREILGYRSDIVCLQEVRDDG